MGGLWTAPRLPLYGGGGRAIGAAPVGGPRPAVRPGALPRVVGVRAQPVSGAAPSPAAPATPPAGPWVPPPLPTGSYSPVRDVETQEATRGLGQLEGEVGTAQSRDTADYATQKAEIEKTAGQQTEDFNRAQQALAQSFQRLGAQQQQGANRAGVLSGGALLQAAMKRAANEGQQSAVQKTNYARQQEGTQIELAKLARELAPAEGANPLGGRQEQDLLTKLTNAQANNAFFGESQQRLAGQEAAERGYVAPTAPVRRAASSVPRVVAQHPQASSPGAALSRAVSRGSLPRIRRVTRQPVSR
jgi:hypothetical protein